MNQKELINLVIECVKTVEDDNYGIINYNVLKLLLNEEIPKQLTLTDVSQQRELLPEFLMEDLGGKIITSVIGSSDVTKEWNDYLGNCG
tara:strand:- start:635 stop:901 length:267 start_codon:yes stop_codon:yes gene_type:complete